MHGLCNMGKSGVENAKTEWKSWFSKAKLSVFQQAKTQAWTSLFCFSTTVSTPCGKIGVGKREMWKTRFEIWICKPTKNFPFPRA